MPGGVLSGSMAPEIPFPPQVVYLVDDDPAVLNSLTFLLGMEGFAVRAFQSGEALLSGSSPSGGTCLVIDYHLPGLDGLEVVASMRANGSAIPAVLITSHPPASVRERAAQAHVPIVEKPFIGNAVVAAIHDAMAIAPRIH